MKKEENKVTRFAIIVLALTMIVLILVSGTYAKYTTEAQVSGTVQVAKWSILVGNKDITKESIDINLFDTIYEAENSATGAVATTNETDVDESKDTKLIAPGTSGKFEIKVTNASEVNSTYSLDFTLTDTSATTIPLEFKSDTVTTWTSNINDLDISATQNSNNGKLAMNGGEYTTTVYWRWAYEGTNSATHTSNQNDTSDTTLGIAAQTAPGQITINAKIIATQDN